MNLVRMYVFLITICFSVSQKNSVILVQELLKLEEVPNFPEMDVCKCNYKQAPFNVPGIASNQLKAEYTIDANINPLCRLFVNGYFTAWMSTPYLLTHPISCIFNPLRLVYNEETRITSNIPGVNTQIPGFGGTETIGHVEEQKLIFRCFENIIERLEKNGYERDTSIRGAPYDFRKGPNELTDYFNDLKQLVEETYSISNEQPVVIIAHSMGARVMHAFLKNQTQEWKDQYIRFLLTLGGVWSGTVKAIETYIEGMVFHIGEFYTGMGNRSDLDNSSLTFLNPDQILSSVGSALQPSITIASADVMRSFPSIVWLFPDADSWDSSQILVQTEGRSYAAKEMDDFFSDLNTPQGKYIYEDIQPYVTNPQEPGVNLHCWYSTGIPTVETVVFQDTLFGKQGNPINGDGDGFVNLKSLKACSRWMGGSKTVMTRSFHGIQHADMLSHPDVLDQLIDLIANSN